MHFTASGFPPDVIEQWKLTRERFGEWVTNDLFSVNWWVMLTLFLLCTYLWWRIADKERFPEYILFTVVTIIIILILDELGDELTLWYYTTDVFPLFPPMSSVDFSCLPFLYMLMFKYAKTWKAFLITGAVMSAVFCFVFEPIFVWSGMYKMLTWQSWWGLPLYFVIPVVAKGLTIYVNRKPADKI